MMSQVQGMAEETRNAGRLEAGTGVGLEAAPAAVSSRYDGPLRKAGPTD